MSDYCGDRPFLGSLLIAQGAVDGADLDHALDAQAETARLPTGPFSHLAQEADIDWRLAYGP